MSEERMPRAGEDGVSPLEQLRELVRKDPAEGEFLRLQKKGKTALKVIGMIEGRHGIYGLNAQRLSDFWKWLRQRECKDWAATSVSNLRDMFVEETASPDSMHKFLVDLLGMTGMEKKNLGLLKYVTTELRKIMQIRDAKEKWQASQLDKVQTGLNAVFEEIKHDEIAVSAFEKITDRMREAGALPK